MRLLACAVAGFVVLGAGAAVAQPMWAPEYGRYYGPDREPVWRPDRTLAGPMTPQQVSYLIETMGLDPVGPAERRGHLFVQRATDDFGRLVRVTIDTARGRIVSVTPANAPRPLNDGPYADYRPYRPGPYGGLPPDADDEFAPPGSMMGPRAGLPRGTDLPPPGGILPRSAAVTPYPSAMPPAVIEAPRASTRSTNAKSATTHPGKTPVPRKRPAVAETAHNAEPGSVAPVPATPAPAQGTKPATPSHDVTLPPVAPLE